MGYECVVLIIVLKIIFKGYIFVKIFVGKYFVLYKIQSICSCMKLYFKYYLKMEIFFKYNLFLVIINYIFVFRDWIIVIGYYNKL